MTAVNIDNGRTWETNADDFARLDQGEGWPFALLVACSVERNKPGSKIVPIETILDKVSARAFAERADTSPTRVLRFLDAWDRAAEDGLCVPSAGLNPSVANQVAYPDAKFSDYYDASVPGKHTGRQLSPERREAITQQAKADDAKGPSMALHVASNPNAMASAIVADPETAAIAAAAVERANENAERADTGNFMRAYQDVIAALDKMRAATREITPAAASLDSSQAASLIAIGTRVGKQAATFVDLIENPVSSSVSDDELQDLLAGGR